MGDDTLRVTWEARRVDSACWQDCATSGDSEDILSTKTSTKAVVYKAGDVCPGGCHTKNQELNRHDDLKSSREQKTCLACSLDARSWRSGNPTGRMSRIDPSNEPPRGQPAGVKVCSLASLVSHSAAHHSFCDSSKDNNRNISGRKPSSFTTTKPINLLISTCLIERQRSQYTKNQQRKYISSDDAVNGEDILFQFSEIQTAFATAKHEPRPKTNLSTTSTYW
ncbi:hypothetical protein BJX66DRAFT_57755 [Aspergillus keveii]|uniref:Uncharacterized protein n=1 Tax=Aspergillus keveii TaxID=714993 RepID=A0ABR4FQS5_9EURO